jgi:TM2 domain-containing membrane protein YozV
MAEFSVYEQMQLTQGMTDQQIHMFNAQFAGVRKDRTVLLVVSIFVGHLGVDRFLLGDVGLGLAKLFTCGGLGVWTVIDWFLIMGRADDLNRQNAHQIANAIRGGSQGYLPPAY